MRSRPDHRHRAHARCKRCGEVIEADVDWRSDLSVIQAEDGPEDSYTTRRSIIGNGPDFERVKLELILYSSRMRIAQCNDGGEFERKADLRRCSCIES